MRGGLDEGMEDGKWGGHGFDGFGEEGVVVEVEDFAFEVGGDGRGARDGRLDARGGEHGMRVGVGRHVIRFHGCG